MNPTTPNHQESEFLSTLKSRLSAHLFKPGITIGELLRHIFMSRTDLHRKLKRETGWSATEYIRRQRLHHARKLLEEQPQLPVSEVAEKVGFGSQSYFSKQFKKLFGCCPKEVKKND